MFLNPVISRIKLEFAIKNKFSRKKLVADEVASMGEICVLTEAKGAIHAWVPDLTALKNLI